MSTWPELPADISVIPGTDLAALWDRFEIFEALHHTMTIDNPMTSDDLDRVVGLLSPADGERAIDLASGHGELLRRLRAAAAIDAQGVDISPWMVTAARRHSLDVAPDVRWTIGEAKDFAADETFDIVTSLGATWIWHGFNGTVRALAQRTAPGGRIAVGEMHVRDGVDTDAAVENYGRLMNQQELDETFAKHGIEVIGRIRTSDAAWDGYIARTAHAAKAWAEIHPGERAERYLAEQLEWESDHARDREVLTWSVWVGRKSG